MNRLRFSSFLTILFASVAIFSNLDSLSGVVRSGTSIMKPDVCRTDAPRLTRGLENQGCRSGLPPDVRPRSAQYTHDHASGRVSAGSVGAMRGPSSGGRVLIDRSWVSPELR